MECGKRFMKSVYSHFTFHISSIISSLPTSCFSFFKIFCLACGRQRNVHIFILMYIADVWMLNLILPILFCTTWCYWLPTTRLFQWFIAFMSKSDYCCCCHYCWSCGFAISWKQLLSSPSRVCMFHYSWNDLLYLMHARQII